MKIYIITEEQLRQFIINDINYNHPVKCIKEFLKSTNSIDQHGIDSWLYSCAKEHDCYTDLNINVYVEVIK